MANWIFLLVVMSGVVVIPAGATWIVNKLHPENRI